MPSTSPGPVGRRWTVEPSRRTTSLPSTVAADVVVPRRFGDRGEHQVDVSLCPDRSLGASVKSRIRSPASPVDAGQASTTRPASSSSRDA